MKEAEYCCTKYESQAEIDVANPEWLTETIVQPSLNVTAEKELLEEAHEYQHRDKPGCQC